MTEDSARAYAHVCAECWVREAGEKIPPAMPVTLRDRVPCEVCGFVTDAGIVVSPPVLVRMRNSR